MTTISIDMNRNTSYTSGTEFVSVSGRTILKYKGQDTKFKFTKICQNGQKNANCSDDTIGCKGLNCEKKMSVYFYGDNDPRPLLVCYDNKAYIPKGKNSYDSNWEEVKDVTMSKCVCEGTGECKDNDSDCCKLLEQLVKVVGFLNEVDLSKHPTATENGPCSGSPSVSSEGTVGTANNCITEKNSNNNSCTYVVDKYKVKQVQIKVTCTPVNGTGETRKECNYNKLTHVPIGMCDASGGSDAKADEKFRLGDVTYPNGNGKKWCVPYYSKCDNTSNGSNNNKSESNWWKPLVKVEAYYYDWDIKYLDPLLVVLEFKKNGGDKATTVIECYKLTTSAPGKMEWTKDPNASTSVSRGGQDLINHLDGIRYCVKKVLKVEIDKQGQYLAMGRPGKTTGTDNRFEILNGGGKQEVKVSECVECLKVKDSRYRCYIQHISSIESLDYNTIGGLAFYIPSKLPKNGTSPEDNGKEVTLYNIKENPIELVTEVQQSTGTQNTPKEYKHIYYNRCMGDVYVYFYEKDPRPGLLCFNGNAYKPKKLPEQGTDGNYDYSNQDYRNWYNVKEIRSCLCIYDRDEEKLVQLLTELYFGNRFVKFFSEHWVELSSGTGTGVVGLSSIGGGGYLMNAYISFVKWFV